MGFWKNLFTSLTSNAANKILEEVSDRLAAELDDDTSLSPEEKVLLKRGIELLKEKALDVLK